MTVIIDRLVLKKMWENTWNMQSELDHSANAPIRYSKSMTNRTDVCLAVGINLSLRK